MAHPALVDDEVIAAMFNNWVTIKRFAELTGYSEDAVRSKIKRGDWREGVVWKKADDGRVLMSLEGFDQWVEAA